MHSELEIDLTLHIISDDGCLKMSSMRENTSEPFLGLSYSYGTSLN